MKTHETFSTELDQLIERNYYSEEWELQASARQYLDHLTDDDAEIFRQMFVQRLSADPSVVNMSLSVAFEDPRFAPAIAAELNRHKKASCTTRTMMYALRPYSDDASFAAVERFVDSSQEIEALRIIAHMNFVRALPHFRRALKQDVLLEVCLHAFRDRSNRVGLDQLIDEMRSLITRREKFYRRRIASMFTIKKGDHAPFSDAEMQRIIAEI